jgi:hypothetical protein
MTVTTTDLDAVLPSDEEVAEYQERGWYVSRRIVSDELLDSVIEAADAYYTGAVDPGPFLPDHFIPKVPAPPGLRKHDYSGLRCHGIMQLVRHPAIAAIAARLSGATGLRLWHDQLLYKPPSEPGVSGNVGWHTDRSYWKACSSEEMITAWVPFHTITLEHGPLMVIDGSNRWGREDKGKPDFFRQDIENQEQEIERDTGRRITKVPVLLERGQVSFHHCRTFHGSGPNLSTEPRRSLAIHLQPSDNHASGTLGPDGERLPHGTDTICRWADGLPDYTDPDYFPVLYP